ncbi:hypothetical protein M8Z33_41825 [Streptomyces sp. ZAF1911]|uniref:hypothetical protein n=1 Tax=Streptomyces sp. ZAF1911 TaxID=2944129 RepID=UPI00237AD21B|nr:hypothetical protein [Streptomyces sp. ZAF1911]MDD9383077.1 hypothetical protein [Streptomyces sp. ZAF1911]
MAHLMVVAVSPADLDRLDALVQEQQTAETRWQAGAEQDANLLALRGPALRAARTRIRAERDRLRENGRHRVSRLHALAPALRTELEHRGLLRDWDPIPEGAQRAGQTLGGAGPHSGTGLTARLVVSLSEALWTPLQRGVYWTNQPHVHALENWKDVWPTGSAAPPEALTERTRITAHITTTGHILRTALHHTLHGR